MLIQIDFSSEIPIYQQIRNEIVMGIADGRLQPGEKLPTIRALADEFGVNTMTVNKAYALLKQEGYIIADRRAGASVAGTPKGGITTEYAQQLRLLISEAKLQGITQEEFLHYCATIFQELEGTQP